MSPRPPGAAALTVLLLFGAACGDTLARGPVPVATAAPSDAPAPTPILATPTPIRVTATPTSAPAPVPATFTGTIVHAPGARVRFGPGTDMPVVEVDRVGRTETFDGWFRRADDTPLTDELSGRIEPWSRDWFHLADGRGWVHSASVRGSQPAAMPQVPWRQPAGLPAASAGLLDGIAFDRQDHPVTCEIASLKMALQGRGIARDEAALLQATGVDGRPAEVDGEGRIERWGDPNLSFVGDPDGHISTHTGYGVYAAPVARAAVRSGARVLVSGTGIGPGAIYNAVVGGHPVVAWVTSDFRPGAVSTWRTWDGTVVRYALNEHAVLVVGVTPAYVLVQDPMQGTAWHARAEFEAAYATFGDMAVIVD